jgi:MFS transporter, YNFM family, putative membrane transport protein
VDAGPIRNAKTAGPQLGAGLTLALLGIAGFAIGANIRITDPLLPTLAAEFNATVGAAAIVAMVFALAHGALQIVYGPLGDKVGKLPVITTATLASAVISFATAFTDTLTELAVIRLACGLATAAVVPLTLAYIGDTTTYEERHVALARFTGTVLLGLMCGQALGGLIADFLGWRAVFYFIAAVFAVAGVGLVLSPALRNHRRPGPSDGKTGYAEIFRLFKRPAVRHVLLAVGAQGSISFTSAAFVGAYLSDRFGLTLGLIGIMLALFAAGGFVYSFFTAPVIKRFGERGALVIGGIIFGMSFLIMAVTPVWQVFAPALFVAGLGLMMVHNMLQVGATTMAPESRGAALSLFAATIFFGQTLGFAVLSPVYDHFGAVPILLLTAICFPIIAFGFRSTIKTTSSE